MELKMPLSIKITGKEAAKFAVERFSPKYAARADTLDLSIYSSEEGEDVCEWRIYEKDILIGKKRESMSNGFTMFYSEAKLRIDCT